MTIPLFWPPDQNVKEILKELKNTLSGRWWGQGPKVEEFEKKFGEMFGFKYCVMVNSGTAALHLAGILAGIKPGDKVICPVFTCTATSHTLLYQGAKIIYADIDPETMTIDPDMINPLLKKGAKALILVHMGGYVDPRLIHNYPVPVIEDACQAVGSPFIGFGDFICLSFQAIKTLSTGDGGMLICKNEKDYDRARRLRWFDIDRAAKIKRNWQSCGDRGILLDQETMGYKYQATDIDASIGLVGLRNLYKNLKHRQMVADLYTKHLSGISSIRLFKNDGSTNWLFMVSLEKGNRDNFTAYLLERGIETNVGHYRNDMYTAFGGKKQFLPNINKMESKYICLPINSQVHKKDVLWICDTIQKWDKEEKNVEK